MAIKARETPSRPSTVMPSSYSGYSQLAQSDAGAEPTEPPAYSNPFHTPIQPQPYLPALPPSTTLPLATFQPLQAPTATNHLAITHKHTPIRGTYTIDTSFIVPAHLLDPVPNSLWAMLAGALGAGEPAPAERLNGAFATESGQIDLVLHVRGGGRANIRVEQKGHGELVRVAVASLAPDTSLSLTVSSGSTILISLPSTFRGLVKGGSERGTLSFSQSLMDSTTTFSVDQQNPMGGRYFVGDWRQAIRATLRGLVKGGSERGTLSFSQSLKDSTATFSVDQQNPMGGRYFVGDWQQAIRDGEGEGETSASWSSGAGGAEERKGPLLIAETFPGGFNASSSEGSSSSAGPSTSAPPAAPQPWTGDLLTVTSEHGDIKIETMEDRAARLERRDRSWIRNVWKELGGCCGGVGALTMACMGLPLHDS